MEPFIAQLEDLRVHLFQPVLGIQDRYLVRQLDLEIILEMAGPRIFQEIPEFSLQHRQFMRGRQGDRFYGNVSFGIQVHNVDGLFLAGFCKGIFQQGTAVPDPGTVVLAGVEMA